VLGARLKGARLRAVQLLHADVRGDDSGKARDGGGLPAVAYGSELRVAETRDVFDVCQPEARE
jgi:hypothetical protein